MMVVPGNAPLIQQDHALEPDLGRVSTESSAMGPDTEPAAGEVGPELEEVRKLRELVRRLELENQHPRTKSGRSVLGTNAPGVGTRDSGLNGTEINNSINAITEKRELQIMADLHHQLSKIRKEEGENNCLKRGVDAPVQYSCTSAPGELSPSPREADENTGGSSCADARNGPELVGSLVIAGVDASVKSNQPNPSENSGDLENLSSNTDLDEVKVLELENCQEDDDSCPTGQWVSDHPSPRGLAKVLQHPVQNIFPMYHKQNSAKHQGFLTEAEDNVIPVLEVLHQNPSTSDQDHVPQCSPSGSSVSPRNHLGNFVLVTCDLTEAEPFVTHTEQAELREQSARLYVSPRKPVDQKPDSPLKWCRQVLDNPSPETEAACRTLITRLDQASRWKNLYCSPLASPSAHNLNTEPGSCSNALNSPGHLKSTNKALLTCGSSGYLSMHSALSSQSSVDSELSTSDDSISMGYKLQDLTDVQVMARLQEESLRQDCASSSASVSRRSSSASLHSLRRGTYSDQEFDTYSLEDEDDYDCSLSYRSAHRYSPSPLSSPRCQSPSSSTDYGRSSTSRIRPPRRSVQSPMQDRLKYANSEEEMRHSMPNLARTSLRTLESVRSSRSLESDLQVPSSRIPRTQQRSAGLAPSKLRYSSGAGQSPLTVRQPLKAGSCTNSLLTPRQPVKAGGSYTAPVSGVRKPPVSLLSTGSPGSSCTSRSTNMVTVAKSSPMKPRTSVGGLSVPRNKPTAPSRRFLQSAQPTQAPEDDSWKDGCY